MHNMQAGVTMTYWRPRLGGSALTGAKYVHASIEVVKEYLTFFVAAPAYAEVLTGPGRIVALYHRPSTLCQIR